MTIADRTIRIVPRHLLRTEPIVQNASAWPNKFKARFLEPGLISYQDIKNGVAFLAKETIEQFAQTFVGKPLVIRHNALDRETGERVGDPKPDNLEDVAVGYINSVWCDPTDGWYWCDGVVFDDNAKKLIKSGWKVSCAYQATGARGPAGVRNGIRYDYETKAFSGEHLAIEPRVRYEGATIVLNSKPTRPSMFKLFAKKSADGALTPAQIAAAAEAVAAQKVKDDAAAEAERIRNAAAEPFEISADTPVEIDGKQVAMSAVVAGYQASLVNNGASEIDPDTEVEYAEGKKAKFSNMVACYKNAMEKEEEEKKENAKKTRNAPAGGHFLRLTGASANRSSDLVANASKISTGSREARIARGDARWGKPVGGKN